MDTLFHQLGAALKEASVSPRFLLDSFPVAVCNNIRISRSRLMRGEPPLFSAASLSPCSSRTSYAYILCTLTGSRNCSMTALMTSCL